jgi:hypothetical protein
MKLYMFRTVPLSIIRSYSLYTQQWYMSHRQLSSSRIILILLLEICLQTCMTYTIAVCTVKNSWWWTEELSETCRVSFQNKFEKLVDLVGFIIRISWVSFVSSVNSSQFPVTHFPKTTCLSRWQYRPMLLRASRLSWSWIISIYIDEIAGKRNLPGRNFYLIKDNKNEWKKLKSCFGSQSDPQ